MATLLLQHLTPFTRWLWWQESEIYGITACCPKWASQAVSIFLILTAWTCFAWHARPQKQAKAQRKVEIQIECDSERHSKLAAIKNTCGLAKHRWRHSASHQLGSKFGAELVRFPAPLSLQEMQMCSVDVNWGELPIHAHHRGLAINENNAKAKVSGEWSGMRSSSLSQDRFKYGTKIR